MSKEESRVSLFFSFIPFDRDFQWNLITHNVKGDGGEILNLFKRWSALIYLESITANCLFWF